MYIRPRSLLGTWVKYNQNCFIFAFFGNSPTGQTRRRMMAQTTRTCAMMCLLVTCSHGSSFRESKKPKLPILGHEQKLFKPNSRNRKTCILLKLTASIPTKFCTVIKTTKCLSWVVPTQTSQMQDGGRPPSWKNRKIAISQPRFERFDEIWHSDAIRPCWPLRLLKIFLKC